MKSDSEHDGQLGLLTDDEIRSLSTRYRFATYGDVIRGNTRLDELIQIRREEGGLIANLENSGCESCYVEVARWSDATETWCRYAFLKMDCVFLLDENNEPIEPDECELGKLIVDAINQPPTPSDSFIHNLPDYPGAEQGAFE